MVMTPERWRYLNQYATQVFGREDTHLSGLMDRAVAAGLPPFSVSADVGRLLKILTSMTRGRLAVEVGTLGGYSAIWIARGLPEGGRLITIEYEDAHADFAEQEIAAAGLDHKIEVVRGAALEVLPDLVDDVGPGSIDFVFIDATKTEYVAYFEALRPAIAPGGLVVADNVYGTGQGWLDEGYGTDDFNRHVAADPDFEAVAFPMRQGVLVARRA